MDFVDSSEFGARMGGVFANRVPDPVLQQVEYFSDPTMTVNDAFKAVSRYWDRITLPEQIIFSLPQAVAAMLGPADFGPAFIGLCQDTQEIAYDYPEAFFEPTVWSVPRPRADRKKIREAAELLKTAKKPLIIAGGGVRYSLAEEAVAAFALERGIPVVETITGSWSAFRRDARFIAINTARFDAIKHRAVAVVGDALETVEELGAALGDWKADAALMDKAKSLFAEWNALLDKHQAPTNAPLPTYAQVVHVVNDMAKPEDTMITAAGGLPGEVTKGWRVKNPGTFDCEFGFSCMGYEVAGGWGHAVAKDGDGTPIVMVGDGSYLMLNGDIYSTVLTGHKMIVVICDNGGYAVINRLQNFKGVPSFNNLIKDCRILDKKTPQHVDFVKHAESMGALGRHCESLADLRSAMEWAETNDRTTLISIDTNAFEWVPGDADWDVGVPEVSTHADVQKARAHQLEIRKKQRVGV